jgi:hypothetical protein
VRVARRPGRRSRRADVRVERHQPSPVLASRARPGPARPARSSGPIAPKETCRARRRAAPAASAASEPGRRGARRGRSRRRPACVVEVDDRQRGRLVGPRCQVEVDALGASRSAAAAEPVRGEAAEEAVAGRAERARSRRCRASRPAAAAAPRRRGARSIRASPAITTITSSTGRRRPRRGQAEPSASSVSSSVGASAGASAGSREVERLGSGSCRRPLPVADVAGHHRGRSRDATTSVEVEPLDVGSLGAGRGGASSAPAGGASRVASCTATVEPSSRLRPNGSQGRAGGEPEALGAGLPGHRRPRPVAPVAPSLRTAIGSA